MLQLLSLVVLCACTPIVPQGDITSEEHSVSAAITEIEVSNAINLYLTDDCPEGTIVIEANENIHQYLVVEQEGDELSIGFESGRNYEGVKVKVYAAQGQYSQFSGSGATTITVVDGVLTAPEVGVELSGASRFVAAIDAQRLDVDASGASSVKLSGVALDCELDLLGASSMSGYDFECQVLDVDFSGASSARLSVEKRITGDLSGASILMYRGNASEDVQVSGSSRVSKQ